MSRRNTTRHEKKEKDLADIKKDLDRYMASYGYRISVDDHCTTYFSGSSQVVLTGLTRTNISAHFEGHPSILNHFNAAYYKARGID